MSWDPRQYLRFADERTRPALDLLARVAVERPRRVYDLGCGPGNSTRLLQDRWPEARLVGVDRSREMLDRARTALPRVSWVEADLATWRPDEPADVLFSNAAFQWLDGHERIFPELMRCLAPGGALAVQMPRSFDSAALVAIREVALDGPWRQRLEPLLRYFPVAEPRAYFDILAPFGRVDVWQTEYLHVLSGEAPVLEWTKGTALRPLLEALSPKERAEFERRYADRVARAYPRRADGLTLFPFRRLFLVATAR